MKRIYLLTVKDNGSNKFFAQHNEYQLLNTYISKEIVKLFVNKILINEWKGSVVFFLLY